MKTDCIGRKTDCYPGDLTGGFLRERWKWRNIAHTGQRWASHFSIATPLPHTDLYHWAMQQNVLAEDFHFDHPGFEGWNDGFIETDEFSRNDLKILRAFEWDRVNFKTKEKCKIAADMMDMTLGELDSHRKSNRERAISNLSI